jgi:membrane protein
MAAGACVVRFAMKQAEPVGPLSLSPPQWLSVLRNVRDSAARSNLALISAGVAFFGLMSAIPGLAALVAIVGLVGEPAWVSEQVRALRGVAPDAVVSIIHAQVERLRSAPDQPLIAGVLFNLLLSLWSALQGTRWVLIALAAVHRRAVNRSFLRRYIAAGRFTLFGLGLGAIAVVLLGAAPLALALTPLDSTHLLLLVLRWPILGGCAVLAMLAIYRWGPARKPPSWRWTWPGAVVAPALWLLASTLLTYALREFPAFGAAYGALASVVALLLWLYLSAYIFLLGAVLNAELEMFAADQAAPSQTDSDEESA